jgi:hypothetical protein
MADFGKEEAAQEAYTRLMKESREVRSLFESAGIPLPGRLARFFDEEVISSPSKRMKIQVPPPPMPPKPADYRDGWIWIPASSATPTTLVRAAMKGYGQPMNPRVVTSEVERLGGKSVVSGTIANIGTRLEAAGQISRVDGLWSLTDKSFPQVVHDGYAWGPVESFDKSEVAAHRRILIIHVLGSHSDGQQIVQLTRALQTCDWVRAPLSKDLVKMDLKQLQAEGKVRKGGGHSGKWEVINTKQE